MDSDLINSTSNKMKLSDFGNFIREFPFLHHSVEIKKENWKVESQTQKIDDIFANNFIINISRNDLYNSANDLEYFAIKVLMWGYATKGRGKNIDNVLKKENFTKLINVLFRYHNQNITITQLTDDVNNLHGVGISTITKFTNFLNTTIEGKKALILDTQIIEAINSEKFEEFNSLKKLKYDNALNYYSEYIEMINKLSDKINSNPEQIEMFLFYFGRNLKV